MSLKNPSTSHSATLWRIKQRNRAGGAAMWLRSTWTDEERLQEESRLEAERLEFIAALHEKCAA